MPYAKVISVVEHVNYVLGITFYSCLLYCLLFRAKQNLGTYLQRIVTDDGLFAMISTSKYDISPLLCAYLALYNLTFVMCDYSFLYRMWAVKAPLRIRFYSHPVFILLLCTIGFIESLVWFSSIYFLYLPTPIGRARLREHSLREFGVVSRRIM
ncbi:hypothetical protein PRIPAC_80066 [Pristionchus pacificus]|uniref:Uncharacterized protein n=1 Tax=Pristionchus pacificus TaxID=54126 RepID=A0A2A6CKN5_PRIPA|nr:hypothetical protein PRIPAC_80066 [Pristionchus pacificus]|eukprot:PDM78679.1 hypothetical protein PRIPAC_31258 [Pristionchus pacificus]